MKLHHRAFLNYLFGRGRPMFLDRMGLGDEIIFFLLEEIEKGDSKHRNFSRKSEVFFTLGKAVVENGIIFDCYRFYSTCLDTFDHYKYCKCPDEQRTWESVAIFNKEIITIKIHLPKNSNSIHKGIKIGIARTNLRIGWTLSEHDFYINIELYIEDRYFENLGTPFLVIYDPQHKLMYS